MVQFEIIAERNDWGPRQKANEIMLVLKDEALQLATRTYMSMLQELKTWSGKHTLDWKEAYLTTFT